jgi:hypothetical protein
LKNTAKVFTMTVFFGLLAHSGSQSQAYSDRQSLGPLALGAEVGASAGNTCDYLGSKVYHIALCLIQMTAIKRITAVGDKTQSQVDTGMTIPMIRVSADIR